MIYKIKILLLNLIEKFIYQSKTIKNNTSVGALCRGIDNINFGSNNKIAHQCNFSGIVDLGDYTTIGYLSTLHGTITIGKFCQLGPHSTIITTNHPISYLSTYINNSLFEGELLSLREDKPV